MHALTLRAAAALAGVALASSTLAAQAASRPTFGVSGGLAIPTGDFGSASKTGYDIAVNVGFHPATSPVGIRIEGMYNRFDLKGSNPLGIHTNILAGTANAIVGATAAPGSIRPYAIGGLGIYNIKVNATNASGGSDTKFGINVGAGLDLPLSGIAAFAEVRYHLVFSGNGGSNGSNLGFIPIVVGVRF